MGRYYSGDIEGKFWVCVQDSDCGKRFGAVEEQQITISYYTSDVDIVEEELEKIKKFLGKKMKVLNQFFKKNSVYSNEDLEKIGISKKDLSEYADYKFGLKIKRSIEKNGHCGYDIEI